MKLLVAIFILFACVMIVGAIEDPCTTEGLKPGCTQQINQQPRKEYIMAHQVETMAYAGEVPWHGLGVPVNNDLTPTQMMKKAGLDWTVEQYDSYAT